MLAMVTDAGGKTRLAVPDPLVAHARLCMQAAIDHPRMFARDDSFEIERAVPERIAEVLRKVCHHVTRPENPLGPHRRFGTTMSAASCAVAPMGVAMK